MIRINLAPELLIRRAQGRAAQAKYTGRHPDRKQPPARRAASSARYRRRHPELLREQRREENLQRLYGITGDDYRSMLAEQGGACAICRLSTQGNLDVDHCHTTGAVRGLLCNSCNAGIGKLRDDPSILRAAIAYLEKS